MTNIAWRVLIRQPARLTVSIAGVAFSVLLILILRGLYSGILQQATEYVSQVEADVWVAQAGAPGDFIRTISNLPATLSSEIEAIEGVEEAARLVARPLFFEVNGSDLDLFLIGVDAETDIGWPPLAVAGKRIAAPGEILVDRVLAKNFDLAVGDRLDVHGTRFTIGGVVRGGNAFVYQFAWANLSDVVPLVDAQAVASYFLVRSSGDPLAVAAAIEQGVANTEAFTVEEFAERNEENLREGFLPMLLVLVFISVAVGVAVIALTIYSATVEKLREYGVLKAIGFSNRRVYAIVFQQSLIAGFGGFAAGAAASYALAALLERVVPVFVATISLDDVAFAAAATIFMSILSSFVPLRPLARLQPAEVFRM